MGVFAAEREDGLRAALEHGTGLGREDADDVGEDRVARLPCALSGLLAAVAGDVSVEVGVARDLGRERVGGNGRAVELQQPVVERELPVRPVGEIGQQGV